MKVLQVTFGMNSASVCTHPDFSNPAFLSEPPAPDGRGNKSDVVYSRWLHSTAASHSAALQMSPHADPPPLPLWLNSYFLIVSILLLLLCSLSPLLFDGCFTLLYEHVGEESTSFPKIQFAAIIHQQIREKQR